MDILAEIVTFLQQLLQAFNLFAKYVPPKTEEQKQEESAKQIDQRMQNEQDGARPTWGS